MKIYLSDYWRKNFVFNLCCVILIVLGTIIFCLWSRDKEDYIFTIFSLFPAVPLIAILLSSKRFLTYVRIEDNKIISYSFRNKKLCVVNTHCEVYYSLFISPQGLLGTAEFIAISNEPFKCQDDLNPLKKRFITRYDMNKQIILPYQKDVVSSLKLNCWIEVD